MPKLKPSIRPSETYTEPNFLRVHTVAKAEPRAERVATIEHLSYQPKGDGTKPGWNCATIVDGEAMSKEDRDVHRAQLRDRAQRARDLRVPQRVRRLTARASARAEIFRVTDRSWL
jgi:uncharacterized membrane protein